MHRRLIPGLVVALVVLGIAALPAAAHAQSSLFELWPEVDIWKRLSPEVQLFFPISISHSKEANYTEGMVGANIDYRFHVNMSIRGGIRYHFSISDTSYQELRTIGEFTYRFFPGSAIRLIDRSRIDLRLINGEMSWRYRNRLRVERTFLARTNHDITPYAMLEAGYDSRYDVVNRIRFSLGTEYVFSPRCMLDSYLTYQYDSRSQTTNVFAVGLALNLTF
jgi:hypothetical protein